MTTTYRPAKVAPGWRRSTSPPRHRVVIAGDLHLPRRPTGDSLAVASELASALDAWVGPGVLVFNGDVFDFADETQHERGSRPRRAPPAPSALERFVAGEGRHMVFLAGTASTTVRLPGARAALELRAKYGAAIALAADLRIATGAGERRVRVEHRRAGSGAATAATMRPGRRPNG